MSGATDWMVSHAILLIVERVWSVEVGLAVREVAEKAGLARSTAARSLKRLEVRGFIRRTANACGGKPATYALLLRGYVQPNSHHSSPGSVSVLHQERVDVFRRKGLSPNALRIWLLLLSVEGLKTFDISLELGLHRSTVNRNLKELERVGLAVQGGYPPKWSSVRRDLGSVARDLGTEGASKDQRLQHGIERDLYYWSRSLRRSRGTTVN